MSRPKTDRETFLICYSTELLTWQVPDIHGLLLLEERGGGSLGAHRQDPPSDRRTS